MKLGFFLGIKYEPLLNTPPVIKISQWGPWGFSHTLIGRSSYGYLMLFQAPMSEHRYELVQLSTEEGGGAEGYVSLPICVIFFFKSINPWLFLLKSRSIILSMLILGSNPLIHKPIHPPRMFFCVSIHQKFEFH